MRVYLTVLRGVALGEVAADVFLWLCVNDVLFCREEDLHYKVYVQQNLITCLLMWFATPLVLWECVDRRLFFVF